MLVAAAAMALASCQREELNAPKETVSATLTMHAGVDQTKTYIDQDNKVLWGTGESVKLYVGAGEDATFVSSTETDAYEGAETASFTFAIDGVAESDSYSLGGVYPASAVVSTSNTKPESYKVQLPATQQSVAGNYDPSAYIMVLKPELVEELHTEYQASFRRATALNKITLTNVAEDINSVEITVPEKKYLAGRRNIDLTTGESGEIYDSGTQTNTVKVTGDFKAGSVDIWFCSWGVELEGGEAMTIKMTSANNIYTRSITVREEGIKFVEGDLNKLAVNMASAEVEPLSNISGEYLIASKTSSGWFLMTDNNSGTYYTATTSVSSAAEVTCADFYHVADVEKYVWNVAKYDNGYSIKNTSTKGYVAYKGTSNEAYANSNLDAQAKMDIKLDGQSAVIESMNVAGRKLQYNASSPRFAFYTTVQTVVYMIPWTPDTTPRIIAETKEFNVTATETTVEIPYTVKNITGAIAATVADGATMTNVNATVADADAKVTVTFDANTESTEKTATIVLSYEGAASVNVSITQAAKPAEGGDVEAGWVSTPFADLQAGDAVVIVGTKSSKHYAMSDDKGTSNPPLPVEVTISSNKLASEPASNIVWYVGVDVNNRIFYADAANGTKWLYCTSSNNGVRVGTNTSNTFTLENGYLKHVGTSRYLGIYNTQDWRCYTSINDNIQGQTFNFFVNKGASVGGGETPNEPTPLTMSTVSCIAKTQTQLTFSWSEVKGAIGYQVFFDSVDKGTIIDLQYTAEDLEPGSSHTIAVKAVGDGTNYTNSTAATCTETTEAASSDNPEEPEQPGGGEQVSKSYVEMFSSYSNTASTNTTKVSISGDACSWTGVGVTTAYWSNFTWGSYSSGVSFLKPGSADAVYLESETLSGGITNLSIAAAANATNAKIKVSVVNVDNNSETVLGTVNITSKKTKFTGSWTVTGISGNYKIKIYNNANTAYANVTDIQWNNN